MSAIEDAPRYPNITLNLTGINGNAFVIIGAVSKALRRADVSAEEIVTFRDQATSGDYDHVLATCIKWVTVT